MFESLLFIGLLGLSFNSQNLELPEVDKVELQSSEWLFGRDLAILMMAVRSSSVLLPIF